MPDIEDIIAQLALTPMDADLLRAWLGEFRARAERAEQRADMFLVKIDVTRTILGCEPDCSLHDRASALVRELERLEHELDEARAIIRQVNDLLSRQPETVAGMTIVEGVQAVVTRLTQIRDAATDAPYYGREWVRVRRELLDQG